MSKPQTFVSLHTATGMAVVYSVASRVNDREYKMEGKDENLNTWSAIGIVGKDGHVVRVRSERMVKETVIKKA
ncbi:MAG: hypothetical protein HGA87_00805 [Desulfobulbaceae bacterium]|nr:hypothetical protein [Desulfobulbaceae bacterium]